MALRAGFLVPYTNTNFEQDLHRLPLPGVSYHVTRIGGYTNDGVPDADQMMSMGQDDLTMPLSLIAGIAPDAVAYACTSASIMHGPSYSRALESHIADRCGARVGVTTTGAIKCALEALGVRRIGFVSPYVKDINDAACRYFEDEGFVISGRADVGRVLTSLEQGQLGRTEIFDLARRCTPNDYDALVLSCTDLGAVSVISELEAETGRSVVTSNQALIFALAAGLGVTPSGELPGRLFSKSV